MVYQKVERVKSSSLAALENEQPPSNNMGVELSHNSDVFFSFDWLTLTIWDISPERLRSFLKWFQVDYDTLELLSHGSSGFRVSQLGRGGFRLNSEPATTGITPYIQLVFPGECISTVEHMDLLCAIDTLHECELRYNVTRIDLALDHQIFKPWDVTEEFSEFFQNVDNPDYEPTFSTSCHMKSLSEYWGSVDKTGWTQPIGARSSEKYIRIYHKQEDGIFSGEWFTRCEMELKGATAKLALQQLHAFGQSSFGGLAIGYLRGVIEFTTDWWVAFVGSCDAVKLRVAQIVPNMQRIINYLHNSVAPSLALYFDFVCWNIFEDLLPLIAEGKKRWKGKHHAILAEARAHGSNLSMP